MKYQSLKIDIKSFATSTLSFTLPVKDIKDPLPYDYGDAFIYAPDGKTVLFYGTVSECSRDITDGEYTDSITVSCFWDKLARTIYVNKDKFSRGMIGSISSSKAGEFVTDALKDVGIDVDFKPIVDFIPFFVNCQTLEWILLTIKRSQPNLTSYWDYSGVKIDAGGNAIGEAKLCFSLGYGLVNLQIGKNIKSISCAQSKQQSDGVVLRYAWTDRNGNRRIVEEMAGGLDYGSPNVTVLEISEEGVGTKATARNRQAQNKMSLQTMTIKGIPVPKSNAEAASKKYWDIAEPRLKDVNVKYGAVEIETVDWLGKDGEKKPDNYVNESHKYVKIEGEIHRKTKGIKHCRGIIRQAVRLEGQLKDPALRALFDQRTQDNKAYGWLESDATLISVSQRRYVIGGNYEYIPEEDEEPEPPEPPEDPPATPFGAIAKQMHDGTLAMGWSGNVVIKGDDAIAMIGKVGSLLNIIGSDSRWSKMRAPIQTVSYDAEDKVATINFGLPDHIEISDQQNAQEPAKKAEDTTASANDPSGWGYDWQKQNEDKDEPADAPNIGGNISGKTTATVSVANPSFQVRIAKGEDGKVLYQIAKGTVYCPNIGQVEVGTQEWTGIPDDQDEIWLVCGVDRAKREVTAKTEKKKPTKAEDENSQYIFIAKIDRTLGTIEQGHIGDFLMKPPPAQFTKPISSEEVKNFAGIIKEIKEGAKNYFDIENGVAGIPVAQSNNPTSGISDIGGLIKGVTITILPKTSSASSSMAIKNGIIDCDLKQPEGDYANITGGGASSGGVDGITKPSGVWFAQGGSDAPYEKARQTVHWKDGVLNLPLCNSMYAMGNGFDSPEMMGGIKGIQVVDPPTNDSGSIKESPSHILQGMINLSLASANKYPYVDTPGLISGCVITVTHDKNKTLENYIEKGIIHAEVYVEKETYPYSTSTYSSVPWDIE